MRHFLPFILLISIFLTSCGVTSKIGEEQDNTDISRKAGEKIEDGVASWYGPNFHGKLTANGEKYDMHGLTAAHRTLPFNTILRVKNIDNGRSVRVRINDRGPYAKNRIIDLSKKAAQEINMIEAGTANVELILLEGNLEDARITDIKVPTYTVQLASFTEKDKAFNHSRKIKGSRVETIKIEDKTIYRVYFGIFVDENEAYEKQKELEREGFEGYVKQIQN